MYLFAYIARKTPSLVGRRTKSLILFNPYETYQFFFNKIITPIVIDFCLLGENSWFKHSIHLLD